MTMQDYAKEFKKIHALQNKLGKIKDELEECKDRVKANMEGDNLQEVKAGGFIVKVSTFTQYRLDSATLKKEQEELYNSYCKPTMVTRFTIR